MSPSHTPQLSKTDDPPQTPLQSTFVIQLPLQSKLTKSERSYAGQLLTPPLQPEPGPLQYDASKSTVGSLI
mgnify:CR=1 FL=1